MTEPQWIFADASPAQFRAFYLREHATTRKILGAFPADQAEFKPAEKSNSARTLAWTFVLEEKMLLHALRGEQVLGGNFQQQPPEWQGILDAFDAQHEEIVKVLDGLGEKPMTSTVKFFVAPKTPGDYPALDFAWFMICDQIHHRGQLTVYIRMVGAKLPSIYGPSGDEPWT